MFNWPIFHAYHRLGWVTLGMSIMTFWGPQILLEDQSTILQIKPLISLNALTTATTLTGTVYVTKTSREL